MTSGHAHGLPSGPVTRRALLGLLGGSRPRSWRRAARPAVRGATETATALPSVPPYQPVAGEVFPNAKTVASRVLETARHAVTL